MDIGLKEKKLKTLLINDEVNFSFSSGALHSDFLFNLLNPLFSNSLLCQTSRSRLRLLRDYLF